MKLTLRQKVENALDTLTWKYNKPIETKSQSEIALEMWVAGRESGIKKQKRIQRKKLNSE